MGLEPTKKEIEVLDRSTTEVPDEKGELQPYTHIVYRDELGMIGSVTIQKKDPSDLDIKNANLAQRKAAAERKPYTIRL